MTTFFHPATSISRLSGPLDSIAQSRFDLNAASQGSERRSTGQWLRSTGLAASFMGDARSRNRRVVEGSVTKTRVDILSSHARIERLAPQGNVDTHNHGDHAGSNVGLLTRCLLAMTSIRTRDACDGRLPLRRAAWRSRQHGISRAHDEIVDTLRSGCRRPSVHR